MSEHPPVFVATSDGADDVVRRARRRRRTRSALVAGATAVVVVTGAGAATLTGGGASGVDRLDTTDRHPVLPTPPSASASPGALSPPTPSTTQAPAPTRAPAQAGPSGALTTPVSTAVATSSTSAASRRSPIHRGTGTIDSNDLCSDDATDAAAGWCVRYVGPDTIRRGHTTALSGEVCRRSGAAAATLRFTSGREIDMSVTDGAGSVFWQAGQGVHYASPGATVTVGSGQCLVWSSSWDTRDRNGLRVPPGTYYLGFAVETAGTSLSSVGVSLTVTD